MKTGGGLAPPSGGQSLKGLNAASIAAIVASAVLLGGGLVLGGSWLWLRRSQCSQQVWIIRESHAILVSIRIFTTYIAYCMTKWFHIKSRWRYDDLLIIQLKCVINRKRKFFMWSHLVIHVFYSGIREWSKYFILHMFWVLRFCSISHFNVENPAVKPISSVAIIQ